MGNAEYRFTLDIRKVQSQETFQVNSGETAWSLLISLTNGGEPYEIEENATVVLSAKKSNGRYLFNPCSIVDSSTIRYDFTSATTDTPGIVQCELFITSSFATIISPRFAIVVDVLVNGDEVNSVDENNFYIKALAQEGDRVTEEGKRIANEAARQEAEVTREQRVEALEFAASGSLYKTTTLFVGDSKIQVKNAMPYGILTNIGKNVNKIKMGLPYDLDNVWDVWYSELAEKLSDNSLKVPEGSGEGIMIPVEISGDTMVTVSYRCSENSYEETVTTFGLYTAKGTLIAKEAESGSTVTVPTGTTVGYIQINFNSSTTLDMIIEDIVVTISNPYRAKLYNVREIPLDGDVIELMPNAVIEFLNNGLTVAPNCNLTYKNKVTK